MVIPRARVIPGAKLDLPRIDDPNRREEDAAPPEPKPEAPVVSAAESVPPPAAAPPPAKDAPAQGIGLGSADRTDDGDDAAMKGLWRTLAIFLIGGVLGTGFGVALGFFLFPFVFPPPPAMDTVDEDSVRGALVATGSFIQPDPNDPIHKGAGKVSVYKNIVFLEPDFEVGPGPDFRVILVPKPAIRTSGDVADTMYIDLGPLRAFTGSQRYEVPAGVDLANYPSVVIWCRTFAVLISPADLSFEGG